MRQLLHRGGKDSTKIGLPCFPWPTLRLYTISILLSCTRTLSACKTLPQACGSSKMGRHSHEIWKSWSAVIRYKNWRWDTLESWGFGASLARSICRMQGCLRGAAFCFLNTDQWSVSTWTKFGNKDKSTSSNFPSSCSFSCSLLFSWATFPRNRSWTARERVESTAIEVKSFRIYGRASEELVEKARTFKAGNSRFGFKARPTNKEILRPNHNQTGWLIVD